MPKKQYPEDWGKLSVPVPPFVFDVSYEELFSLIMFVLFQLLMLTCITAPYDNLICLQNHLCAGLGAYYMAEHLIAIAIYDLATPLAIMSVVLIPVLSFYKPLIGNIALLISSAYVLSYVFTIMVSFEMMHAFLVVYACALLPVGLLLLRMKHFLAQTKAIICAFCSLVIINCVSPVDFLLYAHGVVYDVGTGSKVVICVLFCSFWCAFSVYFTFTKEVVDRIAEWRGNKG